MSTRNLIIPASMALLLACSVIVVAQNQNVQKDPRNENQPVRRNSLKPQVGEIPNALAPSSGTMDQLLAHWVAGGNHAEITLSKIAEQRTKNPAVKQFAARMVEDHSAFLDKLQRFTGAEDAADQTNRASSAAKTDKAVTRNENQTADDVARARNSAFVENATAEHRSDVTAHDLMRIKHQIGKQCLAMAERDLEQAQGAEFDKCYVGTQIGMHMEMLATLEVLKTKAPGELGQLFADGERTTQEHLQMAKNLIHQLEGESSAANSQSRPAAR